MRKNYDNILLTKEIYTEILIYLFLILKGPSSPVKWGTFRRCLSLSDRQLHSYRYFWAKLKESSNFLCLVTLCAQFLWSFPPVWRPPAAARWERKQEIQSSPPDVALEGDWTAVLLLTADKFLKQPTSPLTSPLRPIVTTTVLMDDCPN